MRKLHKEFGTKTAKKDKEENYLTELPDSASPATTENTTHSVSDVIDNTDDNSTISNNISMAKETGVGTSPDLSAVAIDTTTSGAVQSKTHLQQKIDQNLQKKTKQKGAKISMAGNGTDKVADFERVKAEKAVDKASDKSPSGAESEKHEQESSSESVTTTDQQLSRLTILPIFFLFYQVRIYNDLLCSFPVLVFYIVKNQQSYQFCSEETMEISTPIISRTGSRLSDEGSPSVSTAKLTTPMTSSPPRSVTALPSITPSATDSVESQRTDSKLEEEIIFR